VIIEKLKLHGTLKCGDTVFHPGEYSIPNIPKELVLEARMGAKIITILAPIIGTIDFTKQAEERKKEADDFSASWKAMEPDAFKSFVSQVENRTILVAHGQYDKVLAKWFRYFPTDPFPGTEKKEEPSAPAAESEKAGKAKTKIEKKPKSRLVKRKV